VATAVAAVIDGFDVVLVGPDARSALRERDTRKLLARVREQEPVLIAVGGVLARTAPMRLIVTSSRWEGFVPGGAHLQWRRVTAMAAGRGAASRPREAELWLPAGTGEPSGDVARFIERRWSA